MNVKRILQVTLVIFFACFAAHGGDDASGPIHYRADFSQPFSKYELSVQDKQWIQSLVTRLKYHGQVVHFVKTSLPLSADGKVIEGAIYQAIEKPEYFYVPVSGAMLVMGLRWPFSPAVAGFSVHSPKSNHFIVCLNLHGGVPILSSSPVQIGEVKWQGGPSEHD